jgi:hypothetical protein
MLWQLRPDVLIVTLILLSLELERAFGCKSKEHSVLKILTRRQALFKVRSRGSYFLPAFVLAIRGFMVESQRRDDSAVHCAWSDSGLTYKISVLCDKS